MAFFYYNSDHFEPATQPSNHHTHNVPRTSPDIKSALINSATGELTGVGLELSMLDDGRVQVNGIADGSPASMIGTNGDNNERVRAVLSGMDI